jgi:hypothetical protein
VRAHVCLIFTSVSRVQLAVLSPYSSHSRAAVLCCWAAYLQLHTTNELQSALHGRPLGAQVLNRVLAGCVTPWVEGEGDVCGYYTGEITGPPGTQSHTEMYSPARATYSDMRSGPLCLDRHGPAAGQLDAGQCGATADHEFYQ